MTAPRPRSPFPPERPRPTPGSAVVGAVVASVSAFVAMTVGVALVLVRQERIVWQPPRVRAADRATPTGVERLDYAAADGQPLLAYVVRPPDSAAAGRVLLAFHGNAELAVWSVPWAAEVARRTGRTVVLPEYRGYAGLPGAPTYPGSALDARAALAATLAHLPATDVALYGHSLGSAVAGELAAAMAADRRPPTALALESPFTSARAMARVLVHEGMERWWQRISRVHFDTEARVAALDVPVAVAHGALDLIIPASMGRRVHAAARRPGELLVVPRAGHNDVVESGGEAYWTWLARALGAGARTAGGRAAAAGQTAGKR